MIDQPSEVNPAPPRRWWRWPARGLVFCFVIWHLSFLYITNAKITAPAAKDAPQWPGRGAALWVDAARKYESYGVLDQSWGMFASPVWRTMPFPAGRVELSDGTEVVLLSVNEPADMTAFFRVGGARLRKLEHYLVTSDLRGTYQEPMQKRYAMLYAKRWREMNEADPRRVVRVTIMHRNFTAPGPDQRWEKNPVPVVTDVARFEIEEE